MKKNIFIILMLAVALTAVSCHDYEKVPENDMFTVSLVAGDARSGSALPFTVVLDEGATEGECRMSLSIRKDDGGAVKPYTLFLNGESEIDETSKWSFGEDGEVNFTIEGLDRGRYTMTAYVTRWYHTASATDSFSVN